MELTYGKRKASIIGKTYRLYRQIFGKDLLLLYAQKREDVSEKLSSGQIKDTSSDIMGVLGVDFLESLAYICLKTGDPTLPDFEAFVDEQEDYEAFVTFGLRCFEAILFASLPVETPVEQTSGRPKKKKEPKESPTHN